MASNNASVRDKLAPHGALRAAINLSNSLLVTGRDAEGGPTGLSPSVARQLAERLGTAIALVPFATPGAIADAAGSDVWDVALIGSEHARENLIAFTSPYALIEATYLVPAGSRLNDVAEVDAGGVCVAAPARTAYGIWLERNLRHATLRLADGLDAARDLFANGEVDALAGLRPWLLLDSASFAGSTMLSGGFTAINQAIGYRALDPEVAGFLGAFVEEAIASDRMANLMTRLGVSGVAVAPSAFRPQGSPSR